MQPHPEAELKEDITKIRITIRSAVPMCLCFYETGHSQLEIHKAAAAEGKLRKQKGILC